MNVETLMLELSKYPPETNVMLKCGDTIGNIELTDYDEEWNIIFLLME